MMLTKKQQEFILKLLKEDNLSAKTQDIWCRDWFYHNASKLRSAKLVKTETNIDNVSQIYSLTEKGKLVAKSILNGEY